jgi:multimeric flavodoxin WrbA
VKTPGTCLIDDDGRAVAEAVARSHLVVFLTPVTFGGYSSVLKRAVDRLIPLGLPFFRNIGGEIHHPPRYPRSAAFLAVGVDLTEDEQAAEIFRRLVVRNAVNLHAPHCASVVAREGAPEVPGLLAKAIAALRGKS